MTGSLLPSSNANAEYGSGLVAAAAVGVAWDAAACAGVTARAASAAAPAAMATVRRRNGTDRIALLERGVGSAPVEVSRGRQRPASRRAPPCRTLHRHVC